MFLFQNRVGKRHPGSGMESMRKKFWGAPFHGKTEDGLLDLGAPAVPQTRNHPQLAIQSPRGWAAAAAIPSKNPNVTLPLLTRSAEEQIADTALGCTWKDYGLLCGTYKSLYGGPAQSGNFQFEIGHAGWLYVAPGGTVWRMWIHEFERNIAGTSGLYEIHEFDNTSKAITIKARRFGLVRSKESAPPLDTVYSYAKSLGVPTDMPTFSDDSRVAVGTMSLDGSNICIQAIHADALDPPGSPNINSYLNGWGYFTGYLVPTLELWKGVCTGTPGVDFDITITPYFQRWSDSSLQGLDPNETRLIHTWVSPGGAFQDITIEREDLVPPNRTYRIHGPFGSYEETTVQPLGAIRFRICGPNCVVVATALTPDTPGGDPDDYNWYLMTPVGNVTLTAPNWVNSLMDDINSPKGIYDEGDAATLVADARTPLFTRQCYV